MSPGRSRGAGMSRFELFMRARGYDIKGAERSFGDLSRTPVEEVARKRDAAAWEIARFHALHNPLYRSKLGGPLPLRWEDLPVMEKQDYQADLGTILTDGMDAGSLYRASTSGSSGHPFSFAKDKFSHACAWALIRDRYLWHGITLASRQ